MTKRTSASILETAVKYDLANAQYLRAKQATYEALRLNIEEDADSLAYAKRCARIERYISDYVVHPAWRRLEALRER